MTTLNKYNNKRNFKKTKEPKGESSTTKKSQKNIFVVQHHMARREHYDFRLELGGVLKSWAVPKGPSYNTKDRRLAVHTEDHPYNYKNFEGTIPKGEYGGGTVMLWDEGYYEPVENMKEGMKKGSLKFILHGHRLKGKWTLIKYKEDNWLLIKEKDSVNLYSDINSFNTSIKTGRTMEEITLGKSITTKDKNSLKEINITNPDKIISKKPKITKLDIIKYYDKIKGRMMPYVKGRILSTIRAPEGLDGSKFFKKHFESGNNDLKKINLPNENGNKEDYYYIDNANAIIKEVQMNSFEFHVWGSNVSKLNHPNMLVFDLDPDEGMSINKIREGAKDLRNVLKDFSLESFLKVSGGKGYHIVVPTNKLKSWKSAREFAKNIAKLMEMKWPEKYTSNVRKEKRKGKIFIDWIRNTKGATSVAPYSIRIRKGLKVSMPIKWSELDKINPDSITMEEAIKRLKRKDPWENFFTLEQ